LLCLSNFTPTCLKLESKVGANTLWVGCWPYPQILKLIFAPQIIFLWALQKWKFTQTNLFNSVCWMFYRLFVLCLKYVLNIFSPWARDTWIRSLDHKLLNFS
jgi:hypothetical protein